MAVTVVRMGAAPNDALLKGGLRLIECPFCFAMKDIVELQVHVLRDHPEPKRSGSALECDLDELPFEPGEEDPYTRLVVPKPVLLVK